ncbi:HAD-IIB family hydrolase [Paraurantiacibacter namhicola]|uniref:sucrose-phosphate synthase n=1 Tax=Paraurantiacibacter namhicola TaxID=645517 RepID=A0A1C7DBM7_9SPHN|nr:HAD-IIB family hydrolase [Paraurantiacibacter namhicola]ANU08683.1 Mannosylfructose-phosphate synthase [Paraurantiacibacter namhicola]
MFVCHVALQGCLKLDQTVYGITADTGGHIKYLLELARTSISDPTISRIDIVTRGFDEATLGPVYRAGRETDGDLRLVRLDDGSAEYLPKEALHARHAQLCEAFGKYLLSLDELPDVIHAHYADAGVLARYAKEKFDIPYVFTGHSLGAVKREVSDRTDDALETRIAIEENAVEAADAIIASSRDEAEAQYAHYANAESGRIRVIPPGCDLSDFEGAEVTPKVANEVARFLNDSDKPIILAIARPVRKKNLLGLIEAYAASPSLQDAANLVLVAGCRGLIADLEQECREVLNELLAAIDKHDLYGKVAYPKFHEPEDIPAYYALARQSGGVFVNPALNEPFGLTLLEAAAARLPVVATDSGGPNDIVERCKNGTLVCPIDPEAIAQACLEIVTDRSQWVRFASAGGDAAATYDWRSHCDVYHRLLEDLVRVPVRVPQYQRLLICDIDNTLLGDRNSLREFLRWQASQSDDVALGIATGRSFHSAQSILASEGVPNPDVIISSVGTQIHWFDRDRSCFVEDAAWRRSVERDWDRPSIDDVANEIGLRPQALLEQRTGKASFFLDGRDKQEVERAFRSNGVSVEVVTSHQLYLDILPAGINKGSAVSHVADELGLLRARVAVAGDSGNDLGMLRSCVHPIIVGNWSDGLGDDPALSHAYIAKACHAAGVLEGVKHFQARGSW